MTLIQLLVFIVVFVIIACGLYWVITKFFQPPLQMPLLAIVGVILLVALLYFIFPGMGNTVVWGR